MYDPHTDTWEQLPHMIIPRSGSAAAVLYGLIYIIGEAQEGGKDKIRLASMGSCISCFLQAWEEKKEEVFV